MFFNSPVLVFLARFLPSVFEYSVINIVFLLQLNVSSILLWRRVLQDSESNCWHPVSIFNTVESGLQDECFMFEGGDDGMMHTIHGMNPHVCLSPPISEPPSPPPPPPHQNGDGRNGLFLFPRLLFSVNRSLRPAYWQKRQKHQTWNKYSYYLPINTGRGAQWIRILYDLWDIHFFGLNHELGYLW